VDCGDSVGIETVDDQKNQITAQWEYFGLCEKFPDKVQFPPETTIDDGSLQKGRPIWLSLSVCDHPTLRKLSQTSLDYIHSPEFKKEHQIEELKQEISLITGHPPGIEPWEIFFDNIVDCTMTHYCHSLPDVPPALFRDGRLSEINRLETLSRSCPLPEAYKKGNPDVVKEYYSLLFGHYFKVLHDRMEAKIAEDSRKYQTVSAEIRTLTGDQSAEIQGDTADIRLGVKDLYIQVTSDSKITPQLKMLGFDTEAKYRPPWGSAIVYELFKNTKEVGEYAVRITFNGKICKLCGSEDFCSWEEFSKNISSFVPPPSMCPKFYENYQSPR